MDKTILGNETLQSILKGIVKHTEQTTSHIAALKEQIAIFEQKEEAYNEAIDLLTEYIRHKKLIGDFEEWYIAKLDKNEQKGNDTLEFLQSNKHI